MCTESKDTNQEERAIDALIALALPYEYNPTPEDIDEFMKGGGDLSPEERKMLDDFGEKLPSLCRGWQAAHEGALVPKDEHAC